MSRQTKLAVTEDKKRGRFKVDVPASISESGKRERHWFKTITAAKAHALKLKKELKEVGQGATIIKPALAESAQRAAEILEPWGISLVEAARMVAEIRKTQSNSCFVSDATAAWLLACEALRPRTLGGYTQTAAKLKQSFGDSILATITAAQIQEAVCPMGSSGAAVEGHLRNAKAFWRWSAKRGWCDADVFNGVEMPKGGRDSDEIQILTVEQAKKLLEVAAQHYPQSVPHYALQLFAGIRAEEVKRLDQEHVTAEGIELSAEVTKKGRRRHITPNETLAAWLKAYPFKPCDNWREIDKACRRLTGWAVESRLLKEPEAATLGAWPQNALRHSHASYAVAFGVKLETLLFEFGHSGNQNLLRQHYVGRASKKDALSYYSIAPEGVKIKLVKAVA
jgi:site-specific recombinase XerD